MLKRRKSGLQEPHLSRAEIETGNAIWGLKPQLVQERKTLYLLCSPPNPVKPITVSQCLPKYDKKKSLEMFYKANERVCCGFKKSEAISLVIKLSSLIAYGVL